MKKEGRKQKYFLGIALIILVVGITLTTLDNNYERKALWVELTAALVGIFIGLHLAFNFRHKRAEIIKKYEQQERRKNEKRF